MKKLARFLTLMIFAIGFNLQAENYTFPAGSLVIPMDKLNQNSSQSTEGNGIFQAYGLVLELLQQGVTVFWIIDPEKTANDQPDFTLDPSTAMTVVRGDLIKPPGSPTFNYAGGPFIIDANIPADITAALAIRDGLYPGQVANNFDSIVIHQINESFSAPVGALLATKPPKIAVLNTGADNVDPMLCYLSLSGIPSDYYDLMDPADLLSELTTDNYYILWIPHWDTATAAQVAAIKTFMDNGGDVLATCIAIDYLEASNPVMVESTMARNGATHNALYADYRHFDITPSQIGDFLNYTPDAPDPTNTAADLAAHTFSFRHNEDFLAWQGATNVIAWDNYDPDLGGPFTEGSATQDPKDFVDYGKAWAYFTYRKKDAHPEKGDVFYLGGHSYASCFGGGEGTLYRLDVEFSSCAKPKLRQPFFDNDNENMSLVISYTVNGVPGSITYGPLYDGKFYYDESREIYDDTAAHAIDQYLEIFTIYGEENGMGHINTNFGAGCNGAANGKQVDGIFIEKKTDDVIVITKLKVSWACGAGGDCGQEYHLDRVTVKYQDPKNQCGTPYLGAGGGGHLYQDPGAGCDTDNEVEIIPNGFSVTGSGSNSGAGVVEDIAGIRYILNTLLPGLGTGPEYGRSTPVVTDDGIYFGTFTFPGNLGHFRKWSGDTGNLVEKWDTADQLPENPDNRNIFTFLKGNKTFLTTNNANEILPYTSTDLVVDDVIAYISSFRDQPLGGIERSSAAIVTQNTRTGENRTEVAYVNTTFGLMEMVNITNGTEHAAYIPQTLLSKLKFTGRFNSFRPILNSSPTAKDVFIPPTIGDYKNRKWRSYLALSLDPEPGFEVLDITDPSDITYKWGLTDESVTGTTNRVSIGQYRKQIDPADPNERVLSYALVSAGTIPDGVGSRGIEVRAYDIENGSLMWDAFRSPYSGIVQNVIETPPFVALWDKDQNGFDDRILVTDLMGRMWEIDLETGHKPESNAAPEVVYDATMAGGQIRPIGAAPSIGVVNGRVVIGVGTGGVDWSPSDTDASINNVVVLLDLEDRLNGKLKTIMEVDIGRRKLYSPVVFAGGSVFFIAISGDLNSPDPRDNIADVPELGKTELYAINLAEYMDDPSTYTPKDPIDIDKTSGSIYIKNGQAHISGLDGKITRLGEKRDQTGMDLMKFMYWRFGMGENESGSPTGPTN